MARPATFTTDQIQQVFWDLLAQTGKPPTNSDVRKVLGEQHSGSSLSNTTLANALAPAKQAWLQQQEDALLGGPDPMEARWIAILRAIRQRAERDAQAVYAVNEQYTETLTDTIQEQAYDLDRMKGEYDQLTGAYRQLYTDRQLLEQRRQHEEAGAKQQIADLMKERDDARAMVVTEKQRADNAEQNARAWEGQAKTITGERDLHRKRADGAEKQLRDARNKIQQLEIEKATAEQKEKNAEQRRQDAVLRAQELGEELKHLRGQVAGEGSELHRLREEAPHLRSSNMAMAQELGRASQHLSELMEHVLAVMHSIGEQAANKQWQPIIEDLRNQINQINGAITQAQPATAVPSTSAPVDGPPSTAEGRAPEPPMMMD